MNETLLAACQDDDPKIIAQAMLQSDFWLVNVSEPGQADTSAMVLEIEDIPCLVAFTSEDHAGTFAEASGQGLNENDELPCFVVGGKEFMSNISAKIGVAVNPETEHFFLFAPDFVKKLKASVK